MKRKTIYQILALLVTATIVFAGCTKEKPEVRLVAKLATLQVLKVTSDSATVTGFVIAEGEGFSEKGVCYATSAAPTTANSKVVYAGTATTAAFTVKLSGLTFATTYHARAYASGVAGTVYGEEFSFTTLAILPTVSTAGITTVTGKSAAGGGNVTANGGAEVTARGVYYGTKHNPTAADSKTSDAKGSGAFVSALTGLKGNTTYYVRAYAINGVGTAYGSEISFVTPVDLPVVTTAAITAITKVSAISGGEVTYDGGGTVTARGLAWGLGANPTVSGTVVTGGSGLGLFVSNLAGLAKNTVYHVRAYATNVMGTVYGTDVQFTTLPDILTWNIPGDYVGASYPGTALADWSPDKSPQVISTIAAGDKLEGYVYMANSANQWKFATQANWNGPNYGDGGAGKLDGNGGNFSSPKGYYKINANATTMTYTAVATSWGVIGDASPNAWNDETPLTYDPALRVWKGGMHLTAATIKFRANHSWDYNYGSDKADGTLGAGASNIPVSAAADYAITLDLSHPNAYTYGVNRWSLIGDFNSWGGDADLTWNAGKQVFTVTVNIAAAGGLKFRANHDWGLNLGGDLNALSNGGANIGISAAGSYTFTLDPWSLKATITKN